MHDYLYLGAFPGVVRLLPLRCLGRVSVVVGGVTVVAAIFLVATVVVVVIVGGGVASGGGFGGGSSAVGFVATPLPPAAIAFVAADAVGVAVALAAGLP